MTDLLLELIKPNPDNGVVDLNNSGCFSVGGTQFHEKGCLCFDTTINPDEFIRGGLPLPDPRDVF